MFKNYSLDQWRDFAKQGGFITHTLFFLELEGPREGMIEKPPNWREIVAVVNGNRDPIPSKLRDALFDLFDEIVPIEARDPWPTLAQLKDQLDMTYKEYNSIIIQRTDLEKSVAVVVGNIPQAEDICAKWDRIGFEHERLVWFAALVAPLLVNPTDPWFGLMEHFKARLYGNRLRLVYDDTTFSITRVIDGNKGASTPVPCTGALKVKELVRMFNDGDIPPGCATDWNPYLLVDEALPIFAKTYATPAFHELRFHNNKLRR